MAYLLFSARKQMLTNRLNQMNYRSMILSQKQQDLAQQSATLQSLSGFKSSMSSIFAAQEQATKYQELTSGNMDEKEMETAVNQLELDTALRQAKADAQTVQDNAKLSALSVVENQIDLEMKKLDTEIKATTAEMETVEKAEESAIKAAAPKYGAQGG